MSAFADFPRPPEWTEQALCAEVDSELFYPEKGGSSRPAKLICGRCDSKVQCLAYAMAGDEAYGIFGGTTPRERRALKGAAA